MKLNISRDLKIEKGDDIADDVSYEEATMFVTDLMKRNINMISEITEKAIEKYELTKIVDFYASKKYAELNFVDIDINKLTNDFVQLDKVLCIDETYFYKMLNTEIFGFNAISIPHTRTAETEKLLKFSVDNASHYMHVLPSAIVNLTRNLVKARLERGGM